jgi:hypothetical protein
MNIQHGMLAVVIVCGMMNRIHVLADGTNYCKCDGEPVQNKTWFGQTVDGTIIN